MFNVCIFEMLILKILYITFHEIYIHFITKIIVLLMFLILIIKFCLELRNLLMMCCLRLIVSVNVLTYVFICVILYICRLLTLFGEKIKHNISEFIITLGNFPKRKTTYTDECKNRIEI